MTTQESTEKVLRQLYLLLARGENVEDNPDKIIVDKNQAERLLNDLNKCVYDMLENCEMTSRSRDQAERAFKRQEEKMLSDAQRRAEDVYAASIIYSEDSLNRISAIMRDASVTIEKLYKEMSEKLQDEEKRVRRNQTELRSQLHALQDTDQYLEKMKEWREEEERERRLNQNVRSREPNIYANRRTEVEVNFELLKTMNLKPAAVEMEDMGKDDPNIPDSGNLMQEEKINEDSVNEEIKAAEEEEEEEEEDSEAKKEKAEENLTEPAEEKEEESAKKTESVQNGAQMAADSAEPENLKTESRKKSGIHRKNGGHLKKQLQPRH